MNKLIKKIDSIFGSVGYAIGFGCCTAISLIVLALTVFVPLLFFYFYVILFLPFMFFSIMLTRQLIINKKISNRFLSFVYKLIGTLLIWFIAFFPFSWFGLQAVINLPAEITHRQEADQLREKILNSETYADLTLLGLGHYKRVNKGDKYLWDITRPKERVNRFEGIPLVFEHHSNERNYKHFDSQNLGQDVMYDVCLYEGTYIIIPVTQSNFVYLCKEINDNEDLFCLITISSEAKAKLQKLTWERYSRTQIIEKLGGSKLEAEKTKKQEAAQWREKILNSETYADLRPFGLGLYKQINEGDQFLWNITKPKTPNRNAEQFIFEHQTNERNYKDFDFLHLGKDVMYDVYLHEGTYIIIPPFKNTYDVYLCKKIDKNTDLFCLRTVDPKVIEKLKKLSVEQYTRKEITEKLGKQY